MDEIFIFIFQKQHPRNRLWLESLSTSSGQFLLIAYLRFVYLLVGAVFLQWTSKGSVEFHKEDLESEDCTIFM